MKIIIIISSLLILSGCDNSSVNSPIVGGWEANQCFQTLDINDNPKNEWVKSIYDFDANGTITGYNILYSDSDCITRKNEFSYSQTANYIDNGETLTPQGLNGNSITITNFFSSEPALSVQGYYIIENNQLCFSEAISFLSGVFSIDIIDNTEISFNKCLTPKEIPNN